MHSPTILKATYCGLEIDAKRPFPNTRRRSPSIPTWHFASHALGQCKLLTGLIEEVIPLEEDSIRLSPRDPNIGNRYYRIGLVHLLQSRPDAAIPWLEKARSANPKLPARSRLP